MGNRPQEDIIENILGALKKDKDATVQEISQKTEIHIKTVMRWLPLMVAMQGKPPIVETRTTGSTLYRLGE